MLRVCILTETYHPVVGGGETQARLLAEALARANAVVCVVTRRSDGAYPRRERHGPVTVRRVGPVGAGQMKKWGLLVSSVGPLIGARRQYDLIFVSGFRLLGMPAVLVARLFGKKVVLKADSAGEMSGAFFGPGLERIGLSPTSLPFRLFLAMRNRILKRADAFVAITAEGAHELIDAGISPARIVKVPNAVDVETFSPVDTAARSMLREKLGVPTTAPVAVYTGRLVTYKGLPLLLRVWRSIVRDHSDAVLLLVGEGGLDMHNCESELKAYAAAHGISRNVVFTGGVPNVADYLRAADVFAHPTMNDAFPSSLVEAMACGLAIVTTHVGAIPEIIAHGETGLIVGAGEEDAFRAALVRVFEDRSLATTLGAAACRVACERYSASEVAGTYEALFRRLLSPLEVGGIPVSDDSGQSRRTGAERR